MSTDINQSVLSRRTEPTRANRALRLNCRPLNTIAMKSKGKGNEPWRQPEPEAVIYRQIWKIKTLTPLKDRVRVDLGLLMPFLWAFLF